METHVLNKSWHREKVTREPSDSSLPILPTSDKASVIYAIQPVVTSFFCDNEMETRL